MKSQDKIRVAILYGGRSAEHEVSLRSAENVIQYLDPKQFEAIPIGIDKQGKWFLGHDVFHQSLAHNQVLKLHSHTWFTPEWVGKPSQQSQPKEIMQTATQQGAHFDVIFPVMHGTLCEDGTLQGLLEMANLPYVGSGVLASAVGMDKDISKRLVRNAGINVAPFVVVKHALWQSHPDEQLRRIHETLSYPMFVKPANTGSSIGINKVKMPTELSAALNEAFRFDTKVIVEAGLNVQELEIAVLESLEPAADPIVSVVGEIKPNHEYYSYEAKYIDEHGAELCIPAQVSEDVKTRAQQAAKVIFNALDCEGMARVDLFLEKNTQTIYFNEINTIPGFTQISMFPKLMEASGVSYAELLTHLIQLAMKRYQNKSQLIRNYEG